MDMLVNVIYESLLAGADPSLRRRIVAEQDAVRDAIEYQLRTAFASFQPAAPAVGRPSQTQPLHRGEVRLSRQGARMVRESARIFGSTGAGARSVGSAGWFYGLWPSVSAVAREHIPQVAARVDFGRVIFAAYTAEWETSPIRRPGVIDLGTYKDSRIETDGPMLQRALAAREEFTLDPMQGWTIDEALEDPTLERIESIHPMLIALSEYFGHWTARNRRAVVPLGREITREGFPELLGTPTVLTLPRITREGFYFEGDGFDRPEELPHDYVAREESWRVSGKLRNVVTFFSLSDETSGIYDASPFAGTGQLSRETTEAPAVTLDLVVQPAVAGALPKSEIAKKAFKLRIMVALKTMLAKIFPAQRLRVKLNARITTAEVKLLGAMKRPQSPDLLPASPETVAFALTGSRYFDGRGDTVTLSLSDVRVPLVLLPAVSGAVIDGAASDSWPDSRFFNWVVSGLNVRELTAMNRLISATRKAHVEGSPVTLYAYPRTVYEDDPSKPPQTLVTGVDWSLSLLSDDFRLETVDGRGYYRIDPSTGQVFLWPPLSSLRDDPKVWKDVFGDWILQGWAEDNLGVRLYSPDAPPEGDSLGRQAPEARSARRQGTLTPNPIYSVQSPLIDAQGRKYQVRYAVLPVSPTGPVLASHQPGSFRPSQGYPEQFQARDLEAVAERRKIEAIARDLDPDRLTWCSLDPTIGSPVVWRGTGEAGTDPGRWYVLGGNGRAIAIQMAPQEAYQRYVDSVQSRWSGLWPEGEQTGRSALVRVVEGIDYAQAVQLAGATQASTAGLETELGRALSLLRGLGISNVGQLPAFSWSDVITTENVGGFLANNAAFVNAILSRMDPAIQNMYRDEPGLLVDLLRSVMVGLLPPQVVREGLGTRREEQALIASIPIIFALESQIRNGEAEPDWSLLAALPDALAFSRILRRQRITKNRLTTFLDEQIGSQLTLGSDQGRSDFESLLSGISELGIAFGAALKYATALKDPSDIVPKYLRPYYDKASTAGATAQESMFGAASPTMFGGVADYTEEDPGEALARIVGIRIPSSVRRRDEIRQEAMLSLQAAEEDPGPGLF